MKKKQPSVEIQFNASNGARLRARVIVKPCRYSHARYWVVLPKVIGDGERWLLVPSPEKAIRHVQGWLLGEAKRCLEGVNIGADERIE
jgi:hypothetical protein